MKSRRRFYQPAPAPKPSVQPAVEVLIDKLSHDGRGLCRHQGKTLFVSGALPGERVLARIHQQRSKFDEAHCLQVLDSSPQRRQPRCPHFGQCGGCELQHLSSAAQIGVKQTQALDQLQRIGAVQPEHILPALDQDHWHYRRRVRLSVYCPHKNSQPVLGFRRRQSKQLVPIRQCPILDQRGEQLLPLLADWLANCRQPQAISHLELLLDDRQGALVLRHPRSLATEDQQALVHLCAEQQFQLYLQPGGPETVQRPDGGEARLHYRLAAESPQPLRELHAPDQQQSPKQNLLMAYHPSDFTQVNAGINQLMVSQALQLLAPGPDDRILDLFCGLGNFTLPLATRAGEVIGIEGSPSMVARGQQNATANGLDNVHFHVADLTADFHSAPWFGQGFNKILLDPPRAGALQVVRQLAGYQAEKILYVSCDPATLARDAGALVEQGYRLQQWGVMNMFPQTTHVESMALFVR